MYSKGLTYIFTCLESSRSLGGYLVVCFDESLCLRESTSKALPTNICPPHGNHSCPRTTYPWLVVLMCIYSCFILALLVYHIYIYICVCVRVYVWVCMCVCIYIFIYIILFYVPLLIRKQLLVIINEGIPPTLPQCK